MPITITLPEPDHVIGPGSVLTLQSDFIGPLPTGAFWNIRFSRDPEGTPYAWQITLPAPTPFTQAFPGLQGGKGLTVPSEDLADGATVYVVAELDQGPSTVIDSGSVSTTWSNTRDAWYLDKLLTDTAAPALTTEQAQQLADDHAALNPPLLAHDGTPITGAVGDLITSPSLKFLGIDTTTHVLTGSGVLEVPNIAGVQTAWGLVLDVAAALPGSGVKFGYVDSYPARVAQFLLLWPARNTAEAMVIEELRLHLAHFTWLWHVPFSISVAYFIEPGFTVNARFVSAFFP